MTRSEIMLPELDAEMARTGKALEAVPQDRLGWKAAESLHTIGWNANHLADIVGWTPLILAHDELDINPIGGTPYETPSFDDPAKIVAAFDENLKAARAAIADASDEQMAEEWAMKNAGQTLFTMTKGECVRTWVLNHSVHHRGILSIYLRMCGVKLTPVFDG